MSAGTSLGKRFTFLPPSSSLSIPAKCCSPLQLPSTVTGMEDINSGLPSALYHSIQALKNCQGLSASIHHLLSSGSLAHLYISSLWLLVHSSLSSRDTLSSPQQLAIWTPNHANPLCPRAFFSENSSKPLALSSP